MNTRAVKTPETKRAPAANSVSDTKHSPDSTINVVDNRPVAFQLRKQQEMADNSPQAETISQLQQTYGYRREGRFTATTDKQNAQRSVAARKTERIWPAPLIANGNQTIQRMNPNDLKPVDKIVIKQIESAREEHWPEGADELILWAKSVVQIQSVMANWTYAQWTAARAVFPTGEALGNKVAQIQKSFDEKKKEIRDQSLILFRADYRHGMSVKDAIAEGLIVFEHIETFRTLQEKDDKKGSATGPATREWSAKVDGENAQWVLHIHYHDITGAGISAAHVKPWATRKQEESPRYFAKEALRVLAKIESKIDKASNDLTSHEKSKL